MKTIHLQDAVALIPDGATLMVGGFLAVGTPERLIDELVRQGKRGLTVITNDTATPGRGVGKLVSAGLISRTIASHIGLNPETQQQMIAGKMEVDLVPQGTLVERINAIRKASTSIRKSADTVDKECNSVEAGVKRHLCQALDALHGAAQEVVDLMADASDEDGPAAGVA